MRGEAKMDKNAVLFTEEMKRTHTILIPNMLPMHFRIFTKIFETYGYKVDMLETSGRIIPETGLKYVHNDACYPAIVVIGQFINAIQTKGYDPDKTALLLIQTGGGCRASNYIPMLRKALSRAGYPQIPVISLNFGGIEKHPGFKLTLPLLVKMLYALLAGDLLMCVKNQCLPYEKNKGDTERLCQKWTDRFGEMLGRHCSYGAMKKSYKELIADFEAIPRYEGSKTKVGIVGEIYVKFSPLGNNDLENFLLSEGAEPVVPGVVDFIQYCLYNSVADTMLYGKWKIKGRIAKFLYKFILKKQQDLIDAVSESTFTPMGRADRARELADGYIGVGAKMGEGWLLTAEMLELIHSGVKNIVCTQPFGCLPNHISGKGMIKPLTERNPGVNIVAIDYDASQSTVNQQNRIKLMLANANYEMTTV